MKPVQESAKSTEGYELVMKPVQESAKSPGVSAVRGGFASIERLSGPSALLAAAFGSLERSSRRR
jgi:hypothetical protein